MTGKRREDELLSGSVMPALPADLALYLRPARPTRHDRSPWMRRTQSCEAETRETLPAKTRVARHPVRGRRARIATPIILAAAIRPAFEAA